MLITRIRQTLAAAAGSVALLMVSGCGSSATTMTSPTTVIRCAVTVNGGGDVPAQGGNGNLTVAAARECSWTASVEGQWLTIKSGTSGQGDGAVEYAAAPNPDPAVRRGAVVLNDKRVDVVQAAGECSYSLAEPSSSFSQEGGSGRVDVRASSALCAWSAESDAPWIVLRSGSGKGSSQIAFDVAPTTGASRSGTVRAAGQRFTVTQTVGCVFTVDPRTHSVGAAGGSVTVNVATTPSCSWTATTTDPWIAVGAPATQTGAGSVTLTVAGTPAGGRTGSAIVAGQAVAITQGAGCSYALSATSQNVPAEGGGGSVNVQTAAACAWSASSNASWLTITSAASGNGAGTVTFSAAPLTGAARSGALTIAGQAFTVTQSAGAAPCSFSIAPEQQAVDAPGTTFNVAVSSAAGCAWTSTSNAPWISVRATGAESGNGNVEVSVAPNPGAARSGTATIAGRTLTVNQTGISCTFRVDPLEVRVDAGASIERIDVRVANGCSWTAVSNAPWIRVAVGGSGSGDGTVVLAISENDDDRRIGTVTVAGQTVTVNQRKD